MCFNSYRSKLFARSLGLHPDNLFPTQSGKDYTLSPYLEILKEYRDEFTVISGLAHAGMGSSFAHQASASFLTGAPGAGRPGFRNTISLDQYAADHIGTQTRFPSLALSGEGSGGLSWTRTGALIAADNSPSKVFARLFLEGNAKDVQEQIRRLEDGRSILDDVSVQAKSLRSDPGSEDRDKLDEYLASVRALEQRMVIDESWAKKPKPKLNVEAPKDIPNAADLIGRTRLLFDLSHLAIQTDSTRLITIMQSVRQYAPKARHRSRNVRHEHGDADRTGNVVWSFFGRLEATDYRSRCEAFAGANRRQRSKQVAV